MEKIVIEVEVNINAPLPSVWQKWTNCQDIEKWNAASDDWHTTKAENDLKIGGKFSSRMEAKDGSMGFDFWGIYTAIKENEKIEYTLGDDRKVKIQFYEKDGITHIIERFEAETENTIELQKFGWQAILNSFKNYVEK